MNTQYRLPDGVPVPPGYWIGSRTRVGMPYPCVCRYSPCRWQHCTDKTRAETDRGHLPAGCCGALAGAKDDRRLAEAKTRIAAGEQKTGWDERPRPASRPAGRVAQVDGTRVFDDADLWGPPAPATPEPVVWAALDGGPVVPSLLAGTLTEDPEGYSDNPALDRQRAVVRGAACDCPTPWDGGAPVLLLADSPKGPVRQALELSAKPGADVREEATRILDKMGRYLARPWKDTRHALLAPADPTSRVKTRPGWLAVLDTKAVAVIDVPPPVGSGVHCPECHRCFSNASAYQVHKADWRAPCQDPRSVRVVAETVLESGRLKSVVRSVPLLKLVGAGVWGLDPLAPWQNRTSPTPEQAGRIWRDAQDRLAGARWRFGRGQNRAPARTGRG